MGLVIADSKENCVPVPTPHRERSAVTISVNPSACGDSPVPIGSIGDSGSGSGSSEPVSVPTGVVVAALGSGSGSAVVSSSSLVVSNTAALRTSSASSALAVHPSVQQQDVGSLRRSLRRAFPLRFRCHFRFSSSHGSTVRALSRSGAAVQVPDLGILDYVVRLGQGSIWAQTARKMRTR